MRKRGEFVNGRYRVYRPTTRELELAEQLQRPSEKKTPPGQEDRAALPTDDVE